jgi:hypothetical protein
MQNRMTRYLSLVCLMSLGACSSTPSPEPALAAGTASVEAARSSGAPELASVEINNARSKLEKARLLAQAGKQKEAIRMAEQADVDAQLARARAGSERSMRAVWTSPQPADTNGLLTVHPDGGLAL